MHKMCFVAYYVTKSACKFYSPKSETILFCSYEPKKNSPAAEHASAQLANQSAEHASAWPIKAPEMAARLPLALSAADERLAGGWHARGPQ